MLAEVDWGNKTSFEPSNAFWLTVVVKTLQMAYFVAGSFVAAITVLFYEWLCKCLIELVLALLAATGFWN